MKFPHDNGKRDAFGYWRSAPGADIGSVPTPRNVCEVCSRRVNQKDVRQVELPLVGTHMICVTCYHIIWPKPRRRRGSLEDIRPLRPIPDRLKNVLRRLLR